MNLPATQNQQAIDGNPFAGRQLSQHVNHGSVAVESERAVAEARGQMQLAKMFPRDLNSAHAELMDSCKLPALASVAFYSVPRGGGKVTGPSIRIAEEIARVCGNIEYGHRELSRSDGKSEIEVYAWDKQNNTRSVRQLTVMHVMDTKEGPRKLRDQKDIDDKISNVASKQLRGRILAIMPKWLVESALEECRKTLAGDNKEPLSARVRKMTQAFSTYGVTGDHIERYLGHKLDDVLADELVELMGVYNALKEGAKPSDYFKSEDTTSTASEGAAAIAQRAKEGSVSKPRQEGGDSKPAKRESKTVKEPESESGSTNVAASAPAQKAAEASAETPEQQSDDGGDVF